MKSLSAVLVLLVLALAAVWWLRPGVVAETAGYIEKLPRNLPGGSAAPDKNGGKAGGAARSARTTPVEVADARVERRSIDIQAVGSLQSDESVMIAPEIAGRILEIVFAEGRPVKKGDVIAKLDDSLAQAELTQAQARLELAAANNDRARTLSRSGNVTEKSRDEALATYETARAEVQLAQTRLAKHVLVAPFDGIAGVRSVSAGAFIAIGTPIVNVEKIDSLKVDFKVPEINLGDVRVGQEIEVTIDALPLQTFKGEIYAINPMVDVNGRALVVRGRIDNSGLVLRPGLFARIRIKGLSENSVVTVPESAILPRAGESFVFSLDGEGRAIERRVKLGARRAGEVEIVDGLVAPARIIVAGQQRLKSGEQVDIVPSTLTPPPGRGALGSTGASGGRS